MASNKRSNIFEISLNFLPLDNLWKCIKISPSFKNCFYNIHISDKLHLLTELYINLLKKRKLLYFISLKFTMKI